jgi:hypothetical protein
VARIDWHIPENREKIYRAILRRASWAVRPYALGDEDQVLQLCRRLLGVAITGKEWQWRMFQNPGGQAFSFVPFSKESGRIVGHLAGVPIDLKVGSFTRKLFFLVDSVVDPVYQGRGIHAVLSVTICKETADKFGGFTAGLPNTSAYAPNLKMGGTHLFTMPIFFRILDWRALLLRWLPSFLASAIGRVLGIAKIRRPTVINHHFTITEVSRFDQQVNDLWERVSPNFAIAAIRNATFLNWRYFQHPDLPYRVLAISRSGQWHGYVAIRTIEKWNLRIGVIADLFFDPASPEAGQILLLHAVDLLRTNRAAAVWGLFAAPQSYHALLRKAGFFKLPPIKGLRQFHFLADFVAVDHARLDLAHRDGKLLRQGNQWFFSLGDTDLV